MNYFSLEKSLYAMFAIHGEEEKKKNLSKRCLGSLVLFYGGI